MLKIYICCCGWGQTVWFFNFMAVVKKTKCLPEWETRLRRKKSVGKKLKNNEDA
jgi:hypothetical protein